MCLGMGRVVYTRVRATQVSSIAFVNNDVPCHSDYPHTRTRMHVSVTASAQQTKRPFYSCQELTAITPAYAPLLACTVRQALHTCTCRLGEHLSSN